MKKIAFVIGTRPEGIKLAPLINCMKNEFSDVFTPFVISTGQHTQILDDVFNLFIRFKILACFIQTTSKTFWVLWFTYQRTKFH